MDTDTLLHGRDDEQSALRRLVDGAAASRSGLLLLQGEPGSGKSALLRYVRTYATSRDVPVVQALGAQSESEFAFAGLHQLVHPLLSHLSALPQAQADALRAALRLGPGHGDDRFLVSLGVLTLLAEAATPQGLVCLVDDAQWMDQPTVDTLLFVARRLQAEGVVLLLAQRDPGLDLLADPALPRLSLSGLGEQPAAALLADRAAAPADPAVVRELVARTHGNPLALAELGSLLDRAQLAGREALPVPLPLGAGVERAFLDWVRALPAATQTALLVAAAEELGDLTAVLAACRRLGLEPSCLDDAEQANLIAIAGPRIAFRHPVVRTAIYSGAPFTARRQAHEALAAVLHPQAGDGRRAWHMAAATVEPDEDVAAELQRTAEHAQARGGHASAAALLDRAARITPDPDTRADRLYKAARSSWQAGNATRAVELTDEAEALVRRPATLAVILRLRGIIQLRTGVLTDAERTLTRAGELMAEHAPDEAARCFLQAADAASQAGDLDRFPRLYELVGQLHGGSPVTDCTRLLLHGMERIASRDFPRGRQLLGEGIAAARALGDPMLEVWAGVGALYLGEVGQTTDLLHRVGGIARSIGHLGALPGQLEFMSLEEILSGRLDNAASLIDEGLRLSRETGQENMSAVHLSRMAMVHAVRGEDEPCRESAAAALRIATARRIGVAAGTARHALAALAMGRGRWAEAVRLLDQVVAPEAGSGHPLLAFFSVHDRIEAAVRAGQPETAREALDSMESWQAGSTRGEARALLARCRALLEPDDDRAIAQYEQALALHDGSVPLERARTELLLGDALRRARRRLDARGHLRTALDAFERLGASPWAERARHELRATGETARKKEAAPEERLTAQELRIARMAAEGAPNKEIAAQLFLSHRTVEYHLYKIFPKLGVASRTDLARLFYENPGILS
ncbi:AAA family ATPase [Catellatospora sp. NPDC049609]|uniref:helix-turn-helix transcriptional regulator n=1 Tax=Catellatospora sp. NPDC049609 TaxID=3155505 RepID=UPI003414F4F9